MRAWAKISSSRRSLANEGDCSSSSGRMTAGDQRDARSAAFDGGIESGGRALARALRAAASKGAAASSMRPWHRRQPQRRRSLELRQHARRHGGSLQRNRGRSVAPSAPQCPPREVWVAWSANGGLQTIGGGSGGSASAAAPTLRLLATCSAPNLKDPVALVARSDFRRFGCFCTHVQWQRAAGRCAGWRVLAAMGADRGAAVSGARLHVLSEAPR